MLWDVRAAPYSVREQSALKTLPGVREVRPV